MTRAARIILLRLLSMAPTLLVVACGAFLLLEFAPGDAVDAYLAQTGGDAGYAAELRRSLGLGGTVLERLSGFLLSLASLDLGRSVIFSRPVASVIAERLPNTLLLMATTTLLAGGMGLALGIVAGRRPGSWTDCAVSTAALGLLALPNFWLALVLVVALAVMWPIFPVSGLGGGTLGAGWLGSAVETARHLVLPTLALGAGYIALYLRTVRAGMIEAWSADHVRAARARGLAERDVLRRGVVRPALLPTVVVAGQNIGTLVGGSVVVETVFAIPGMGRLAFEAVTGRDTALMVGVVMTATLLVLAINLVVDLALARLDPRIGAADA